MALAQKTQTVETKEERAAKFQNQRTASAPGARPLKAGYQLVGEVPDGFDAASLAVLVKERQEAKIRRDFEAADALQAELTSKGVYLDDRRRQWSVKK